MALLEWRKDLGFFFNGVTNWSHSLIALFGFGLSGVMEPHYNVASLRSLLLSLSPFFGD